ncbi:MAG TPA: CapA family protein, partial [Chloroflexi bacterium]|nr:CapA family protein [Chloroflexota bacterium]
YYTILNLEAPLRSDTPIKKWINLYQAEPLVEILKSLNVIAVNVANNHVLDWGEKGLERLLQLLDAQQILHFGAGMSLSEALAPVYIRVGNKTVGFMGYGWREEMCVYATPTRAGVAPLREKIILQSLRQLKERANIVVANLHWGYEYELYPLPIHRQLAHHLVEHGANLVIGHHPHIVQAVEIYQEKPIYYSLGDFYFGSLRHRFESLVDDDRVKHLCKYGLGVVFDVKTGVTQRVFFETENYQTRLCPVFDLDDLSDIPIPDYDRNFPILRTSSRKPILYYGFWHQMVLNPMKLALSHFKDLLHKFIKPVLKKAGVYDVLRRQFKGLKKRW